MFFKKPLKTTSPKTPAQLTGASAEQIAADFLAKNGIQVRFRNVKNKFGEIDLIAQDGATWVFIEVRYRKNATYGSAVESVNLAKQTKLQRATLCFLQQKGLIETAQSRIDVIGVTSSNTASLERPTIEWIKNAF